MEKLNEIYYIDEFRDSAIKMRGLSGEELRSLALNMKKQVLNSTQKDPTKIFFEIIETSRKEWTSKAAFPLLGDWHHFLVPGVLLSAVRNCHYEISNKDVAEGIKRGEQARVSCGFTGVCGGANSIGIVAAVIKKVTPLHDEKRQEVMCLAAQVLQSILKVKRRCCLMSSYTTIKETVRYLASINFVLPMMGIVCPYSSQNSTCAKDQCPFYNTDKEFENGVS